MVKILKQQQNEMSEKPPMCTTQGSPYLLQPTCHGIQPNLYSHISIKTARPR